MEVAVQLQTSKLTGEFSRKGVVSTQGFGLAGKGERWVARMPVRFLLGAAVWMGKPREEVERKMF